MSNDETTIRQVLDGGGSTDDALAALARLAAAAVRSQQLETALEAIGDKALRQHLDWMHFHEEAMADPFAAESEAQRFCQEIAALAAAPPAAPAEQVDG